MISSAVRVVAENLTQTFDNGLTPFRELNFDIPAGQFVALLGPSGCGKTTLLRLVAGLTKSAAGKITRVEEAAPLAYVFQDAELLPWRNVLGNVELPLELMGIAKSERERRARQALREVSLDSFSHYYPAALSGGMKMRVSLARALVNQPALLLLDEPFAALDEVTRFHLDQSLFELWRSKGMTTIFVTHSISEAAFLSQRILMLGAGSRGLLHDLVNPLPAQRNMDLRARSEFGEFSKVLFEKFERLEAR